MDLDHAIKLPRLYAIADTATLERRGLEVPAVMDAWLEAGVRLIQLRHKGHFSRQMFETAKQASAVCGKAGAILVIDDRADIARLVGASVHVGQDDLSPGDARMVLGQAGFVGFSTHNEDQLRRGDTEPVDYLAIGPVYSTASKENPDPVIGLESVRNLRRLTSKPLVAIGGITLQSAPGLLRAGIDSLAVIGDLLPTGNTGLRGRAEEWVRAVTNVL